MLQTAAGGGLTAAVLIGAVWAVRFVITLVTGWDAGAIVQALKLLGSAPVAGTLGGCIHDKTDHSSQLARRGIDLFKLRKAKGPTYLPTYCDKFSSY